MGYKQPVYKVPYNGNVPCPQMEKAMQVETPHFGEFVKQTRERKGWSQRKCALLADWTPQQWNYLENKTKKPEKQTVEFIAGVLKVPPCDALRAAGYTPTDASGGAELTYETAEDENELLSYYRGVPSNLKPAALAQLRALRDAIRDAEPTIGKRVKDEGETGGEGEGI